MMTAARSAADLQPGRRTWEDSVEFSLDLATDVLRRTPGTLRALLEDIAEPWVRRNEGPETFSPFDNLGHLMDGEETDWIPRARVILARGPSVSLRTV